jgi:hypothetical protein
LVASRLFRRLKSGPHGQLVELYAAHLVEVGLARHGTWRSLTVVSDLLSWIARGRSMLVDLDERMVGRYLRHRARKQTIQQGRSSGVETVAVGVAQSWHDRAPADVANHLAGPDVRRVR